MSAENFSHYELPLSMKIEMDAGLQNRLCIAEQTGCSSLALNRIWRRKMGATGEYEYIVSEVSKATDFCGILKNWRTGCRDGQGPGMTWVTVLPQRHCLEIESS